MEHRHISTRTAGHVGECRSLMARAASTFVAKYLLAACGGGFIDAARRRLRRAQAQLVIEQRGKLRRDEVRRLLNEHADTRIAEAAVAAHLTDADVAVPVGNRAVCRVGFETNAFQTVDWRDQNGDGGTVERNDVDAVKC